MLKKLNRTTAAAPQKRPVKVLQFGGGNFLRGFAGWMIDILNENTKFNGAIQIVQSMSAGAGSKLNQQEGLYHVIVTGIRDGKPHNETRLITSVAGTINPHEDFEGYLKISENPDLEFVISNTTESGIVFNSTDSFPDHIPSTFPGKLTVLLYNRYLHFNGAPEKGLIIIPCELIERNGDILRDVIIQYAQLWDLPSDFRDWIIYDNTFCNSLVDRIVPGFPKDTIKSIQKSIGYDDALVVMAEPYYSWVIESPKSLRSIFPTEQAGLPVLFTDDIASYRTRKVRILNGAHTTLVPVAYLKGFRSVRESVEDPEVGNFLKKAIFEEIIPTLDLPSDELEQFANDVLERFINPSIHHLLTSISLNSISKYKVRVLPSVLRHIEIRQQMPERLLFSLAALIRFYKGTWQSEKISVNDSPEVLSFFKDLWKRDSQENIVRLTLANKEFWGKDLTAIPGLAESVTRHLKSLEGESTPFLQ